MTVLADAREGPARAAERATLLATLTATRGNRSAAAEALGVSPRHIHRRIAVLELTPELDQLATLHGWHDDPTPSARSQRARWRSR